MNTSFVLLASCLLVLCSAFPLEDVGHKLPEDQTFRNMFNMLDVDHNNDLTSEEMKASFAFLDDNVDGQVTKKEFITVWLIIANGHADNVLTIFSHVDTNNDGVLDLTDIERFYTYFDTNADGKVDMAEFVTRWISIAHSFL